MRLLMITAGFLPYEFSENLCNGKLVYAMRESDISVDVISRSDDGPAYSTEWKEPWAFLKENTYELHYDLGNKLTKLVDAAYSGWMMSNHYVEGVRWARRAYMKALRLMESHYYDAVLTRSPSDIAHLVGYKLKQRKGVRWIANWNDPAEPIWPEPYRQPLSRRRQLQSERFTRQLLMSADVNTFPSDFLCRHFVKSFPELAGRPTMVIPHIGLSDSLFVRIQNKPSEKLRLCHSGNLSVERNPELLFAAMRELCNEGETSLQLDIMGYTNDYVTSLISRYHLQGCVNILGPYPYMSSLEKMQDYAVLVLIEARMKEGIFFPSKLTDYAQTGRPVLAVSPRSGFVSCAINKFGGGLAVDNDSVEAIKDALRLLLCRWREGTLSSLSSDSLYARFCPSRVVGLYGQLIGPSRD